MRAAVIERVGEPPVLGDVPEPERGEGQALVDVLAVPLNPVDLSIAAGRFYAGPPQTPYVPGNEGVGRVVESDAVEPGTRIWFTCAAGFGSNGTLAQRALAPEAGGIEVPEGVDDALAGCFGIAGLTAWLALTWRGQLAEGETVLVLGASGAVGQIAVQAAGLLGADRVVAAARDTEAVQKLGADDVVALRGDDGEALREATGGGADLTVDPLWGAPAAAAVEAAAFRGRIVHLGQSAGPESTLRSGAVRGKALDIRGFPLAAAPQEEKARAYRLMLEHAAAGRLGIEHETLPLERVQEAWECQAASPHRKLVLRP
jgi:NADPH:quinone reductase-like Zn-dependent oxidoreductase